MRDDLAVVSSSLRSARQRVTMLASMGATTGAVDAGGVTGASLRRGPAFRSKGWHGRGRGEVSQPRGRVAKGRRRPSRSRVRRRRAQEAAPRSKVRATEGQGARSQVRSSCSHSRLQGEQVSTSRTKQFEESVGSAFDFDLPLLRFQWDERKHLHWPALKDHTISIFKRCE
jgi:hypothetical protein